MGNTNIENQGGENQGKENERGGFSSLVSQAKLVLKRFPVSALCSVALCIFVSFDNQNAFLYSQNTFDALYFGLIAAFICAGIANIYLAFKDSEIRPYQHAVALACVIGIFGAVFYREGLGLDIYYLIAPFILILLITPYNLKTTTDGVIWKHIADIFLAAGISAIAGIAFGLSCVLIFYTVETLFGLTNYGDYYDQFWFFSMTFVSPILGLMLMPQTRFEAFELPDPKLIIPRSFIAIVNYILTPAIFIYLTILHIYGTQILLKWSLPQGDVASIVVIFSLSLIGFVLIVRPWQPRISKVTNWVLQYWPFLLITPVLMLFISLNRRISDYGFTPPRYFLLMIGFWLAGIFICSLIKRKQLSSILIIASLAFIWLASCFGPWGMDFVSGRSQANRLISFADKQGLIENGKLVDDYQNKIKLTTTEANQWISTLLFLHSNKQLYRIEPIFEGHKNNPFSQSDRDVPFPDLVILRAIQGLFSLLESNGTAGPTESFYFSASNPSSLKISNTATLYHGFITQYDKDQNINASDYDLYTWLDTTHLHVKTPEGTWKVALDYLKEKLENPEDSEKDIQQVITINEGGQTLEFIFESFALSQKNEEFYAGRTYFSLIVYKNPS